MNDIIQYLVNKKISLAPLAGVSDLPFRLICRRFSCPYAFTEMVDARAILLDKGVTYRMMSSSDEDRPLGIQIVGEDINDIVEASKKVCDRGFSIININAACPVPKIKKKGKGVAMMEDPLRMGRLTSLLVSAVNVPVVFKIRSGVNQTSLNYKEVGHILESEGASGLFIHPRSAEGKYKSVLFKHHITELVDSLSIPVFASGNIFSPQDVLSIMTETGCHGVAIARGALGKPWIFSDTLSALENKGLQKRMSSQMIKELVKEHFDLMCQQYTFLRALPRMHKHLTWYFCKTKNLDRLMREFRKVVSNQKQFDAFLNYF